MRDPLEDMQIRIENLQHYTQVLSKQIAEIPSQIAYAVQGFAERLDTMEFQFKELEKWHKRMWAVTQAESKIATLNNESGESPNPKARVKTLKEAGLSREDVITLAETFNTDTTFGRREKAIALGYWAEMTPLQELRKFWDITGPNVQQIAHKALRKLKHRKIARKLLGADAPF